MDDCLFCKIADGRIPSDRVYEDDEVVAFRDIDPQAPVHVLVIPRRHIESADALAAADAPTVMAMFAAAQRVARALGVAESGYRLVTNIGADAGQSVQHLHLHLLGGRSLQWPPG